MPTAAKVPRTVETIEAKDNHRYDIYMNGFGVGYIELMAMLNKVNMFINSLICNGRYNL